MSARFPLWRTRPAGFAVSGYWPILTGLLAVLGLPVLLGLILNAVGLSLQNGMGVTQQPSSVGRTIEELSVILMFSPIVSWAPMIAVLPLSNWAARVGYAGWGIAALAGAVTGWIVISVLEGEPQFRPDVLSIVGLGAAFALLYWCAIRLMHPTALGIDRGTPPS